VVLFPGGLTFEGPRFTCVLGYKVSPIIPPNLPPLRSSHTVRAKKLIRKHLFLRIIPFQLLAMISQLIISLLLQQAAAQLGDILSYKVQRYSECSSLLSTCQPTISSSLFLYKLMVSYTFPMRGTCPTIFN